MRIILGLIEAVFVNLWNGIIFLCKKRIGGIPVLLVVILIDALIWVSLYWIENISIAYLGLFIFWVPVLVGAVIAKKIIPENNFKEELNEYNKYNIETPIDIPVEKFRKEGESKNLGLYLGCNISTKKLIPIYLNIEQRFHHLEILGSTGSGKTSGVLFPAVKHGIKNGEFVIIIDGKADILNIKTIYSFVKEHHREKDFMLFSLSHVGNSCTYNPLQLGDATQLKDKIIGSMDWTQKDARFYKDKCSDSLQILFYEHQKQGKEPLTFSQVHKILQNPDPNIYPELTKFLKTEFKNISSLMSFLSLFMHSTFSSLLEEPKGEIDIFEAWKNKKIIYFALDTQSYSMAGKSLAQILICDLTTLSGIIQNSIPLKERHTTAIFIDEFQQFGNEATINLLARGRASKFTLTILHQSLADLVKIGGVAYMNQIMQNTNTKICMKTNEFETAKILSDSLGVHKTIEKTHQTIVDKIFSKLRTIIEKVVDKKIIPPQVFLELKPNEAIYIHGKESCKIILSPILIDEENAPFPEKKHRETKNNDQKSSKKPPPKSVF